MSNKNLSDSFDKHRDIFRDVTKIKKIIGKAIVVYSAILIVAYMCKIPITHDQMKILLLPVVLFAMSPAIFIIILFALFIISWIWDGRW